MSTLTVVRHAQATPFETVADRLSALGERQARCLGEYWRARGMVFDEIYTGTLERQRRTAELSIEGGFEPLSGLDEYDVAGMLGTLSPALASRDPAFSKLVDDFERQRDNRRFQRMFEVLIHCWLDGSLEHDSVEPWRAFHERVRGTIRRITAGGGSGRRVAAFTSGGVVGVAVQLALDAPERMAIEVNWRVRNCSMTEFIFSADRLSLDSFNGTPHLEPGLCTFR